MTFAQLPELQGMADAWDQFLAAKGWSLSDACLHVYGRTDEGEVRGHGSLHPLMHGKRRPGAAMVRMLQERLGIDLSPWESTHLGGRPLSPMKRLPSTRAHAAVMAYESRHAKAEPEPPDLPPPPPRPRLLPEPAERLLPPSAPAPRLALSIGADGRGSLQFNLVDAPAADIMRAFNVLQGMGLVAEALPKQEETVYENND